MIAKMTSSHKCFQAKKHSQLIQHLNPNSWRLPYQLQKHEKPKNHHSEGQEDETVTDFLKNVAALSILEVQFYQPID